MSGAPDIQAASSSATASSAANSKEPMSKLVILDADLSMGGMITREIKGTGNEGYVLDSARLIAAINLVRARTKKYGEFEVFQI